MRIIILIFASLFLISCKKNYTCQCFNNRKGFVILQYSNTYKQKKKSQAQSKCETDYKSTSVYHEGDYCQINESSN